MLGAALSDVDKRNKNKVGRDRKLIFTSCVYVNLGRSDKSIFFAPAPAYPKPVRRRSTSFSTLAARRS